eukprot:5889361-Ditylum_brightwellii.AAC.1
MPFPGFEFRRVAPVSDDSTVLPWWLWQWRWQLDNCVLLVPVKAPRVVLGCLGVSVGIASSVLGLTWLAAHNTDSNDNDNDA